MFNNYIPHDFNFIWCFVDAGAKVGKGGNSIKKNLAMPGEQPGARDSEYLERDEAN